MSSDTRRRLGARFGLSVALCASLAFGCGGGEPNAEEDDTSAELGLGLVRNDSYCPDPRFRQLAARAWDALALPSGENRFAAQLRKPTFNAYTLYDIQTYTNNYLRMAASCGDIAALSKVVDLYTGAAKTLTIDPVDRHPRWLCRGGCTDKAPRLVGKEVVLDSAQFLFAVAQAIRFVLTVPAAHRTRAMTSFLTTMTPVVDDHLKRWIFGVERSFSVSGWGCTENQKPVTRRFNHAELVEAKAARTLGDNHSYCDAVFDTDLWIMAAATERLHAGLGGWAPAHRALLYDYLGSAYRLAMSRFAVTRLVNDDGASVEGTVFDPGAFTDHSDMAYAACTDARIASVAPLSPPCKHPVAGISWDISHSRRLVHVLGTFEDAAADLQRMPGNAGVLVRDQVARTLLRLGNQIAFGARLRSKQLRFANYLDGHDGWYRVSHDGSKAAGTGPSMLSKSILTGGYGFLGRKAPAVRSVMSELLQLSAKPAATEWTTYYAVSPLEWIMIYPTFTDVR